jgi:hypothetical protein
MQQENYCAIPEYAMEFRVMVATCENGWFVEFWSYHPRLLLHQRFMAFEDHPEMVRFPEI